MFIPGWLVIAALTQPSAKPVTTHRAYVQASLFASIRPAGSTLSNGRIDQNLGGTTAALSVSGGVWVSHSLGVEGEFVYAGSVTAPQVYNYGFALHYTAESQQMLLDALMRFRPTGTAAFEVVAGGGWGRNTDRETSVVEVHPPSQQVAQPDQALTRDALTLMGGTDFPLRVGAHVAIVPGVRFRWLKPLPDNVYLIGGTSSWTIEFGAGVRIQ